jgi:glycosidase
VKDTIPWAGEMDLAKFYKTLLSLRKSNAALAADASYTKLVTSADNSIFAYKREKDGKKAVVILNLSKQPQKFTIKDPSIYGEPMNIFMGVKEKVNADLQFSIEQWGYIVYDYN